MLTIICVTSVVFLACCMRAALGFGDALLAMPLLVLLVGLQTATPLVAFAAATIGALSVAQTWGTIDFPAAARIAAASLVGIPFGVLLLSLAPETAVKACLGAVLMLYGLYHLFTPGLPTIHNDRLAYVFGFVAGVLGGAYNTNGPPVVMYGMLRRWPPERFRATLQCYFLVTGVFILVGHGVAGLWSPLVLQLYLYSIPAIVLGLVVGGQITDRIPSHIFSRVIYGFLVAVGLLFFL